jgi:hypothetical protein
VRDKLEASQVHHHVYFRYTPCLTDFTFDFIRRPTLPILSPSSRTFVELTLVSRVTLVEPKMGHTRKRFCIGKVCAIPIFLDGYHVYDRVR